MKFEEFSKRYNEMYKAYNRIYHELSLDFGISDSAFNILYELRVTGCGITQKHIGSALFLSKQTVNSSIRNLEKLGFVVCKDGAPDRRMKYVELTDSGRDFCSKNIDRAIEMEANAFERLTKQEVETLLSIEEKHYKLLLQESIKIRNKKGGQ